MSAICQTCGHPDAPHRACAEHLARPIARQCTRCDSWMSAARAAPDDELVCSWCRKADNLAEAEKLRAQLPGPPQPAETRRTRHPKQTASELIKEWAAS